MSVQLRDMNIWCVDGFHIACPRTRHPEHAHHKCACPCHKPTRKDSL